MMLTITVTKKAAKLKFMALCNVLVLNPGRVPVMILTSLVNSLLLRMSTVSILILLSNLVLASSDIFLLEKILKYVSYLNVFGYAVLLAAGKLNAPLKCLSVVPGFLLKNCISWMVISLNALASSTTFVLLRSGLSNGFCAYWTNTVYVSNLKALRFNGTRSLLLSLVHVFLAKNLSIIIPLKYLKILGNWCVV